MVGLDRGEFLKLATVVLITSGILLIAFFFFGHLASTAAHREAISPFLTGGYYFPFRAATLLIFGISLPLTIAIEVAEVTGHAKSGLHLGAWLVLIAGLVLILSLVYAGQLTALTSLTGS